jgi:hypothetical protein
MAFTNISPYQSENGSIDNIEDLLPIGTMRADYYDTADKYINQNPNDLKYLVLSGTNIIKNGAYNINSEILENTTSITRWFTVKFKNKVVNFILNGRAIEVYNDEMELISIDNLPYYYRVTSTTNINAKVIYFSVNHDYLFISIASGILWTDDLENWNLINGNFASVFITSYDLLLAFNTDTNKWQWSEDFENFTDCTGLENYIYTQNVTGAPVETNNNYIFLSQNGTGNNKIVFSADGKSYSNYLAPGTQGNNNSNRIALFNSVIVIAFNGRIYTKSLSDFLADTGSWTLSSNSATNSRCIAIANNLLFTGLQYTSDLSTYTTLTNDTSVAFDSNALMKVIYKNSKYYIYQSGQSNTGGVWVTSTLASNSFTLLATIPTLLPNINIKSDMEFYEIGDFIIANSTLGLYVIDTTDDSVELILGTEFSSDIKQLKLSGGSSYGVKVRL